MHHVQCNSVEDPDNQNIPFLAVDSQHLGQFYSSYHHKYITTDDAARTLVSIQHILFYPILQYSCSLHGTSLHPWHSAGGQESQSGSQCSGGGHACRFWTWLILLLSSFKLGSWQERVLYATAAHAGFDRFCSTAFQPILVGCY